MAAHLAGKITGVKSQLPSSVAIDASIVDASYTEVVDYFCERDMNIRLQEAQHKHAMIFSSDDNNNNALRSSQIAQLVSFCFICK